MTQVRFAPSLAAIVIKPSISNTILSDTKKPFIWCLYPSNATGQNVLQLTPKNTSFDDICAYTPTRNHTPVRILVVMPVLNTSLVYSIMKIQSTQVNDRGMTGCNSVFGTHCFVFFCIEIQRYMCMEPGCNTKFTKWSELQNHVNSSHPVECEVCHKSFARRALLNRHMKGTHLQADRVPCEHEGCGKDFSSVSSLHLRSIGH
jgi:hypothetical protein